MHPIRSLAAAVRSTSLLPALAAVAALSAGAPALAHADADADARWEDLRVELNLFVIAPIYTQDEGIEGGDYAAPAARCDEVVAEMARLGSKPTDIMDGREPYPFKQAPAKCAAYRDWKAYVEAARGLVAFEGKLATDRSMQVGDLAVDETWAPTAIADGAACTKLIDDARAAGAVPTMKASADAWTLPEARVAICDALVEWGRTFGPAHEAAKAATRKAARERYTRFGAAGDRLDWLLRFDPAGNGAYWYVKGCSEVGDPAKLVKAPVLMMMWTSPDGTVSIQRLQFKGNKLVRESRQAFFDLAYAQASGCK